MMLFMCVPMLLGRKHKHPSEQGSSKHEVAELREELARLKADRALQHRSEALDG